MRRGMKRSDVLDLLVIVKHEELSSLEYAPGKLRTNWWCLRCRSTPSCSGTTGTWGFNESGCGELLIRAMAAAWAWASRFGMELARKLCFWTYARRRSWLEGVTSPLVTQVSPTPESDVVENMELLHALPVILPCDLCFLWTSLVISRSFRASCTSLIARLLMWAMGCFTEADEL